VNFKEMALESLVRLISRRCVEYKTDIWHIADKYRWSYEETSEFVECRSMPTSRMLKDIAHEFETKAESLKEILKA
jgi:hypothetical protein